MTDFIICHEFQVTKQNGDIDFIVVFDLPERLALKFVCDKYPNDKVEPYKLNKLNSDL